MTGPARKPARRSKPSAGEVDAEWRGAVTSTIERLAIDVAELQGIRQQCPARLEQIKTLFNHITRLEKLISEDKTQYHEIREQLAVMRTKLEDVAGEVGDVKAKAATLQEHAISIQNLFQGLDTKVSEETLEHKLNQLRSNVTAKLTELDSDRKDAIHAAKDEIMEAVGKNKEAVFKLRLRTGIIAMLVSLVGGAIGTLLALWFKSMNSKETISQIVKEILKAHGK